MNDIIYAQPPEAVGAESEIEGTIFKVNTKYLDEKSAKNEELEKRLTPQKEPVTVQVFHLHSGFTSR